MTAIDVSSVTRALETLLLNTQSLTPCTVCRGEPINRDPNACPWIGIYRRQHDYVPRTLGKGSGHRQFTGDIVLIVQETDTTSGGDCEDLLDGKVKDVLDAIFTDPTISQAVDMVNEVKVTYSYDTDGDEDEFNHYFQTAFIQLTLEASTT